MSQKNRREIFEVLVQKVQNGRLISLYLESEQFLVKGVFILFRFVGGAFK